MPTQQTIAAILFPGFELLDVFGPLEAFGMLAEEGQCKVLTVAESAGAVASRQGPKTLVDFSFDDCPRARLVSGSGRAGHAQGNHQRADARMAARARGSPRRS